MESPTPSAVSTIPPRDVLVVGGGLAATALVAALRSEGFDGEITVAGDEPPHDRPPLTKELFSRDAPADLREQFSLVAGAARWLTGVRAVALTPGQGVSLADAGGAVPAVGAIPAVGAAAVVLAVGARPVVPPGWDGARSLSNWEDAAALRAVLVPGSHVLVAGAGWIGLELAGAAAAAGVRVSVVEETGLPAGRLLPPAVAARIAGWLGEVDLVAGRVTAATAATLDVGERTLRGDAVVAALGARPATGWLPRAWLGPGGHVVVDTAGRVPAAPGIWAIGDCAAPGGIADQHWNAAVAAAGRCARALLGLEVPPVPPPHVFSTMFGHRVDVVGRPAPDLDVVWREGGGWTALLLQGDTLVAGVAVDRPRDVSGLRRVLAHPDPEVDRAVASDVPRLVDSVRRR